MIAISYEVFGLEEAQSYYLRAPKKVKAGLREGLRRAGRILREEMKRRVDKVSGLAHKSIRMTQVRDLEFAVGPTVPYGEVLNRGRSPGQRPPPLSSPRFQNWLASHGIPRREWFAVARSIGRNGTIGSEFMDRSLEAVAGRMFKEVDDQVRKALGK